MKRRLYRLKFSIGLLSIVCIVGLNKYGWSVSLHDQLHELWSQIDASFPPNFGKTHFIVGQKILAQKQDVPSKQINRSDLAVYFSPDDDVRSVLLDLIEREQQRISVAVFTLTDKIVAQAFVDAHNRGVSIELITDPICLRDRYNKIGMLCDAGVPVYVYNAHNSHRGLSSSMHHKFVIFDTGAGNASCVWTGSYNFTRSAYESNQENVVVSSDELFVTKFSAQFERLKQRSYVYKKGES